MPNSQAGAWLEREVEELRKREASYRERLVHQSALAARLQGYSESLQRMLRGQPPSRAHLASTLLEVAKLSSQALDIRRTSIWLFDAERTRLCCTVQLIAHAQESVEGLEIETASCPAYIRALSESHAVAVEDVFADARTTELEPYLREHGVGALLDIPIVIPGMLLGVVCHEHVGLRRVWHWEEIEFASNVGSLVALALETERRLTAEHLAQGTEAKYRHLVESLPVTVYSFDVRTGKLDYVSPRVFELGGWAAEQWLAAGAERWIEMIHADDRAPVAARFHIGTGQGFPEEITYRVQLPDGQSRWMRDSCRLVRDHLGHPLALQGMLCDVTQQREAELERTELERRYRTLLENVDLFAVMLDSAGCVTFVNDSFCRATGFERGHMLGENWFERMAPETKSAQLLAQFRADLDKGLVVPRFEIAVPTKSGQKRRVLWTNTVLRRTDGSPQGTCSLGLDLTQRMQLESELVQQTKLESLGRLAAGVAHDFNNLLTIIMAEVSLLDAPATDAERSAAHDALHGALSQAAELTRSLLVYGRKQAVSAEVVVVDLLITETLPLAQAMVGADLETTSSLQAKDARVTIDRTHLRQLILNLVGNAADATRGHGSRVRLSTHIEWIEDAVARKNGVSQGGEFVVLTVSDDGRGIDVRTLARIFDPFFTTKTDGRGTGLGLAMCKSIVEHAAGFIGVESAEGAGTSFRVYLPKQAALRRSVAPAAAGGSTARLANEGARVLVVEDMEPIRNIVVECLHSAGYRVQSAEDTASAAHVLASENIDLLITDGTLPDGSGQVLARSARAARPELRVLLMSGSAENDGSCDATLEKPFDTESLLRAVAELLSGPTG